MKKTRIVILSLCFVLSFSFISFGKDNDSLEYQSYVKYSAEEVIKDVFSTYSDFSKNGVLFWDGDILKVGIKKDVKITNDFIGKLENIDNVDVVRVEYSTKELMDKSMEIYNFYTSLEGSDHFISIGVNDGKQRVDLVVNKISSNSKNIILDKYSDFVKILVDNKLEQPKSNNVNTDLGYDNGISIEVSRKRNWTVLGGGIGLKMPNNGMLTSAGIGYKSGKYFLITAGHGINSVGSKYYQYSSMVGYQHANAAVYNSSDIGLVRIQDSKLGSINRRASNRLYLNDKDANNYSGYITGVNKWPAQGDLVSKSGITTNVTNGKVVNSLSYIKYSNYPYGVYVTKVAPVGNSNYSSAGDSGGTTYMTSSSSSKIFVGIHSAGDGTNGYFAPAHQLYSSFGNDFSLVTWSGETTVY